MAIIKDLLTPFGIVAKYHRILKAEFYASTQKVEILFAIYASKEARDAGGTPLWHENISVPFDAFEEHPLSYLYSVATQAESYLGDDAVSDAEVMPKKVLKTAEELQALRAVPEAAPEPEPEPLPLPPPPALEHLNPVPNPAPIIE